MHLESHQQLPSAEGKAMIHQPFDFGYPMNFQIFSNNPTSLEKQSGLHLQLQVIRVILPFGSAAINAIITFRRARAKARAQ